MNQKTNTSKKIRERERRKLVPLAQPPLVSALEFETVEPRSTLEAVIQSKIELSRQRTAAAAKFQRSPYPVETRRPLVCLMFVLPMILIYELATRFQGSQPIRSGIDQWLYQLFGSIGIGQVFLWPLITAGILIAWHHQRDDHWQFRLSVLAGMVIESIGIGLVLFCAAKAIYLMSQFNQSLELPVSLSAGVALRISPSVPESGWSTSIAMLGSGIYEELFFRLILLAPVIAWASTWSRIVSGKWIGIVLISLLFASLHYDFLNPAGTSFELSSFLFRFGASVIFSVLFLFRGFGIAVGSHVAFDILTHL